MNICRGGLKWMSFLMVVLILFLERKWWFVLCFSKYLIVLLNVCIVVLWFVFKSRMYVVMSLLVDSFLLFFLVVISFVSKLFSGVVCFLFI